MRVETVSGPNPWRANGTPHTCYFCAPERYPAMPELHTICARCGQLIYTPEHDDPMNLALTICEKCETDIA